MEGQEAPRPSIGSLEDFARELGRDDPLDIGVIREQDKAMAEFRAQEVKGRLGGISIREAIEKRIVDANRAWRLSPIHRHR